LIEDRASVGVLGERPFPDFRSGGSHAGGVGVVAFEPAVLVYQRATVEDLDDRFFACRRRGALSHLSRVLKPRTAAATPAWASCTPLGARTSDSGCGPPGRTPYPSARAGRS